MMNVLYLNLVSISLSLALSFLGYSFFASMLLWLQEVLASKLLWFQDGFDATLASGGFADSVMLKMVTLGQFIRAVLKSDHFSKI